jgi:hypothetical protein
MIINFCPHANFLSKNQGKNVGIDPTFLYREEYFSAIRDRV